MIRIVDIEKSVTASSVLFTDALGTPTYITKSQLFDIAAGFAKVGFGQSTLESPLSLSDDKYTLGSLGIGIIIPTEKLDVGGWVKSFGNVLEVQATNPTAPSSGLKLYADPSNHLSWRKSDGFIRTLYDSNTASRFYQLPNSSGTIALLTDITSALVWGSITGTLSNQTDLQNALNLKLSIATAASTYVPFTGGTLTGQLTLFNSIRIGGTGVNDNNIYFGKNSFISRTSGTNNTAIGSSSLGSLTSGSNNVAIGNNAGGAVTSGSTNILIGANVANGITVGSKNTIIGSNIAGLTAGLSNTIILADGDGNRRLNIFSDGNTMIGTNSYYGETRLGVFGGSNGANVDVRGNSGAFVDQATIELEGADYDTNTRSTYLQYRGVTYSGTTNGFSNNNLARLVLNGDNNLIWSALASPIIFGTDNLERMRLLSNGNFIINKTTDSGDKLQINGNINITDSSSLRFGSGFQYISNNSSTSSLNFGSNGGTNMSIINGNVLINTVTDSGYKLDVNGTGRFLGDLRVSKTDPNFSLVNTTSSTTLNLYSGAVAAYSFNNPNGHWFQTEGAYRLKVMSSAVSVANNLGVGTETPEARLDVNGDLKVVNGGKFIGQAGSWYNGTQVLIDYAGAGRIQAYNGAVSTPKHLLLQWAGGQVGIGTSVPGSLLHIADATNAQLNIDSAGTSNGTRLRFLNAATNYNWQIATQQNVAESFEITPSTVVGGDIFTTPALRLSSGGTLTVNNLSLTGTNSYNYYTNNANGSNPTFPQGLAQSWNKSGGGGEVNFIANKGAGSAGGFEFGSWNGTIYKGLTRLLDNGNFGINTFSPNSKLDIVGGGASDTDGAIRLTNSVSGQIFAIVNGIPGISNSGFSIRDVTNAVDRLTINSSGLGIGTSNATNQVHIKSGNPVIRLEGPTTSGFIDFSDTRLHLHAGNGYLALIAGSTERVRIAANGNVLIGTSTDNGAKLQVNGTISATNLIKKFYTTVTTTVNVDVTLTHNFNLADPYAYVFFITDFSGISYLGGIQITGSTANTVTFRDLYNAGNRRITILA